MKLGVHSMVFEGKYNLEESITKASSVGYDGYEIDIGVKTSHEEFRNFVEKDKKKKIKDLALKKNIEICSLCLGILWKFSLASKKLQQRKEGIEIVKECIDLASFLGAKVILIPIGQPSDTTPRDARNNAIDSLNECIEKAEEKEVILGVENVCQKLAYTPENLLEIVKKVNSKWCEIYYDVGNPTFIGLDPIEGILKLNKEIMRVHLKDTRKGESVYKGSFSGITGDFAIWGTRKSVEINQGDVNYPAVLQALKQIKYDGYLILESSPENEEPKQFANRCRQTLLQMGFI